MSAGLHFFHSFKFKISALVTSMVVVVAVGVGGVSLLIADAEMRKVIARQELSLLNIAASSIENDLADKRQLLKSLTEQENERAIQPREIQSLLEAHNTLREEFFNVTAFDVHGDLVASLRDRRTRGTLNIANRTYFRDTLRSRDGLVSQPFKSALSGRPVVVITQPVTDAQGQITAVLVAAIDLERPTFFGHLKTLTSDADGGYLFIVTGDGTLIHHPDKELILRKTDEGVDPLVDAVLLSPEGWQDDMQDGGQPVLLAHKRLTSVDWTLVLSTPIQNVFAPMVAVRLRSFGAAAVVILAAGFFGWMLTKALLRPLRRLHRHVENISAGTADIKVFDVSRRDEFGLLSRAFFALSQHRARAEEDLHRLATTDALTGINNRRMFDDFLPRALARAGRSGQQVGLAFLDIDHFKQINDTHGHAAGDAVLVEFARRLAETVRCTDTLARLAGDEFVILFEQLSSTTEINLLGRKILDAIEAPFTAGGVQLQVSSSIGIAVTRGTPSDVDDVMRAADQALYGVKAAGRNGFAVNYVGEERLLRVRSGVKAGL